MKRSAIKMTRSIFLITPFLFSVQMAGAEAVFDTPVNYTGSVGFSGPEQTPLYAGSLVEVSGEGFAPEQEVILRRGKDLLSDAGLKAGQDGTFSFSFTLPQDAALGLHPVVIQTESPDSAAVVDLKVSPKIPLDGADGFDVTAAKLVPGLYQVAYSGQNDAVFVAASAGRPPQGSSTILRLDPATLDIQAQTEPAKNSDGEMVSVFGIATDDRNGTIWVSNTRHNSVAVYRQDDLSLVKQFPQGSVEKPRDLVINATNGRAYVSTHRTGQIEVFDTASLDQLEPLQVKSAIRGGQFGTMSLALDEAAGQLYTVSLRTPEVARIDLTSGEVVVFEVPGASRTSGVAVDPASGHIFVASQGSDNIVALDGTSGAVLFDTPVGAGTLNVALNPKTGQLFVTNRASDTITVLDPKTGQVLANLDGGSLPNHLTIANDQTIFAVNKSRGPDDARGDYIRRISIKP